MESAPAEDHGAGVMLEIYDDEAKVVRRIFVLNADGHGLRTIAKMLSLEGCPSPEPLRYKDGRPVAPGWKQGAISTIINQELYRGVHV